MHQHGRTQLLGRQRECRPSSGDMRPALTVAAVVAMGVLTGIGLVYIALSYVDDPIGF